MLNYITYKRVPVLENIEYYSYRDIHAYLFKNDAPLWAEEKVNAKGYVNYTLGMGDIDDFGGQIYYFVSPDKSSIIEEKLINWVNNLVLDQISDVCKPNFFPSFPDCKVVNNW